MIKKWLSRLGTFFLYLVSLLPFWFLYLVSDVLFVILYYITRYRRNVVQENLSNSFPEKTAEERKAIEKRYYKYMADLMVETIKCVTASEKEIRKRMVPANADVVERYFSEGKSIVAATGHYCNWEMSCLRFGMLTDHRRIIIYKPQSNEVFTDFFNKTRSRFGSNMIAMKQTLRKLIEYKNEITFTVLASDQTPTLQDSKYFINFLNHPTAVFLGVEKLGQLGNSVVVFFDVDYIKRGYYSYSVVPLCENPKEAKPFEITKLHVKHLENVIRNKPEYWLWSHRRWKFKPENIHHLEVELIG